MLRRGVLPSRSAVVATRSCSYHSSHSTANAGFFQHNHRFQRRHFQAPAGIPTLFERGASSFYSFLTATTASSSSSAAEAAASASSSSTAMLGVEPALLVTLTLTGVVFRLLTLGVSIYSDVCVARLAAIVPSLQQAFLRYQDTASRGSSLQIEIELAFNQLKERRQELFLKNQTSNARIVALPALVAAATGAACVAVFPHVAQGLAAVMAAQPSAMASTSGVEGAVGGATSWLLLSAGLPHVVLLALSSAADGGVSSSLFSLSLSQPTAANCLCNLLSLNSVALYLAVVMGSRNVSNFFAWRSGFSDRKDERMQQLSKSVQLLQFGSVFGCYALASLAYGGLTSAGIINATATTAATGSTAAAATATVFWPMAVVSYMGPILLGMTLASKLQTLARQSSWTRLVFTVPSVPRSHGKYGDGFTGGDHILRMHKAFETHESHVSSDQYEKVKEYLEIECDRRIARNERVAKETFERWVDWGKIRMGLKDIRGEGES